MTFYLGVDGGGTKTQTFLADIRNGQGTSLVGSASNPNSVGWDNARDTVLQLIEATLQKASASRLDLSGICIGMAGIDRKEQIERLKKEMTPFFPNIPLEVVNDALPALTAGTEGESGVVLVAGTGSICVGEDEQGHTERSGGFGYLIGDEGSGFDIGRQGILAAIQSVEGRGPKTKLWSVATEFFGICDKREMITKVYESNHPVGKVASFAKGVLEISESDSVAFDIVKSAVAHCQRLVTSVVERLPGPTSKNVVLSGGLFTNTEKLKRKLQSELNDYRLTALSTASASGAVLRAIRANGKLTPTLIAQWKNAAKHTEGL